MKLTDLLLFLGIVVIFHLQVDKRYDATWLLLLGGLEVVEAVVRQDEPALPPGLPLTSYTHTHTHHSVLCTPYPLSKLWRVVPRPPGDVETDL